MSQSNVTATADDSDQPSAVLQNDVSVLRKETEKLPLDSTCHIQTTDTVDEPYSVDKTALALSTSNQKIGGTEDDIPTPSSDQSEQRQNIDQVSGQTQCNNVNAVVSGLGSAFEEVSVDGFECSAVGSSTEQPAITKSLSARNDEPLFEDISMDGEVGQDTTAGRAGRNVSADPLNDSGGLKTDTQGEANVLQTCFTGILSSEDGGNFREPCKESSTPQQSKSCSETASGLIEDSNQSSNTTQEKILPNGSQSMNSRSSGSQSSLNRSKRKRHRRDEMMEHSGLECAAAKQAKQSEHDELVTCLRLQGVSEDSSLEEVAEELVRCLHEPKFYLVKQVVKVLGVKQTLNLFHETSRIQEEGGQFTIDGGKRRSPGGMFLTLVKTTVTPEQKKEIFQVDKDIIAKRQREEKRRLKRKREGQLLKEKAEWQLEVFRAQLEGRAPDSIVGRRFGEYRNMHKRLFGTAARETDHGNEDSQKVSPDVDLRRKITEKKEVKLPDGVSQSENGQSSVQEVVERMEVEVCEPAVSSSSSSRAGESGVPAETLRLRGQETCGVPQLSTEEKLAEEFEQMNECDLDVGIELDV